MGNLGAFVLQGVRNFFGKNTSNQIPANNDVAVFNSALNEWRLQTGISGTQNFLTGYQSDKEWKTAGSFGSPLTNKADQGTEAFAEGVLPMSLMILRIILNIGENTIPAGNSTIVLRKNGVDIASTLLTVPFGVTGVFDTGVIAETFSVSDRISIKNIGATQGGAGKIKQYSYYMRVSE